MLLTLLVGFLLTPTGCYLSRAGWEEAKILGARRSIDKLVRDPSVDAGTRGKLALVLAARRFAADSVRLAAKESFTQYTRLASDTLVLVLNAAYRDQLRRYTWWFPIVGRVPYKGYFDVDAAQRAARDLDRQGFDVYLRPSSAFSTLGWFNDPVLSTTLREDSVDLANTVIHELTHNTFYAAGQAIFNESFANFVGARGASWFFRARGDTVAAAASDARWADEKVLGRFYGALYHELDSAFKAHPGGGAVGKAMRIAVRDTIFARARETLASEVAPQLRTISPRAIVRSRLDNSTVLSRRVYLTDLELFDAVHDREGRDLRRAIERVVAIAKATPRDPYAGLRAWLEAHPPRG